MAGKKDNRGNKTLKKWDRRQRTSAAQKRADDEFGDPRYVEGDYDYDLSVKAANKGCLIAFAAVMLVLAVVLLVAFLYVNRDISGSNATATGIVKIDVPSGANSSTIAALLEEHGLIANDAIFKLYSRFNSAGAGFQAGRFEIEAGMSYDEIIYILSQPPPPRETMRVTFPEGSTVMQFAAICEKNGLCTAQEFIDAANNIELYSDIAFFQYIEFDENTWMRAEGYLAPDTYEVYVDEGAESIVRRLYEHFNNRITTQMYDRMNEQGLSLRDTIALASMVEEEASNPDENQARVAGVFWNRLSRDLSGSGLGRATLGSDVTYYYLRDWIARDYGGEYDAIPQEYIQAYLRLDEEGLPDGPPVGPISNPSLTAIQAVLWPEQHDYFYFLTDFYGEYYYARNYSGHQNNIATMNRRNAQWEQEQEQEDASEG